LSAAILEQQAVDLLLSRAHSKLVAPVVLVLNRQRIVPVAVIYVRKDHVSDKKEWSEEGWWAVGRQNQR
jgi:hypothetical protein